jgi:phosphonate transport system substrate-binding protein
MDADVGFMCAPPYIWLRDQRDPSVELLGVAPLFNDPRVGGKPVYFSDVIVRSESVVHDFEELLCCRWSYNDDCSLSGYYSLLEKLGRHRYEGYETISLYHSGSHLKSIELVSRGEVDAAAIDSNVLAFRLAREPHLQTRLRVIDSLGPYPIQPLVVRSLLEDRVKQEICECLLSWSNTISDRKELRTLGLQSFVRVTEKHYAPERAAIGSLARSG